MTFKMRSLTLNVNNELTCLSHFFEGRQQHQGMEGQRGPHWFLAMLIIDEESNFRAKGSFPCERLTHQITQTLTNQITVDQTKIVLH